jgi:hypothetical protein
MWSRTLNSLWIILLFLPVFASAQIIKGKVSELNNEKFLPVAGAHVYWKGHTDLVSVTNSKGMFEIKRTSTDTLVVSMIGFEICADTRRTDS